MTTFLFLIRENQMNYIDARQERRGLKQKLFTIRRYVEGEAVELNDELLTLKKNFEAKKEFTSWGGFPESWDIGDPHGVKQGAYTFDERDEYKFSKIHGKKLFDIVNFEG